MKSYKIPFLLFGILHLFSFGVLAEIKLPAIVSSNMVLQRNTNVVLWGWADAGEKISITASWIKAPQTLQADNQGNWRTELKTTNSLEPQTINLKGKVSNITLDNVLFGEVWLCSGQSNMERPMKGIPGEPVFGSAMAIAKSHNPNLRLFKVGFNASKTPLNDLKKYLAWQSAAPECVNNFSAVAYFYGQQLQEILGCPVGIIATSVGGSAVETWISKEALSEFKFVNLDTADSTRKATATPTVLFNSMISPLIPYTIKGALWYQGEANRKEPENYKKLFPAMVKDWRTRWNIGDFPFFYVQLAPYSYGNKLAYQISDNSAFIREAQLKCLDLIPNSGMAVTLDVGDENSIHPSKKKEVADRLLFLSLSKSYGFTGFDFTSPNYDSYEVKDGGIMLSFKNIEAGIFAFDRLTDFEIAGSDKVFFPAEAKIVKGKTVFVSSQKVVNPVAVRYAWSNWVKGSLFGNNLLPVSSFRTDNWDDATRGVE